MKHFTFLVFCIFVFTNISAQDISESISKLEKETKAIVSFESATNTVQFIRFPLGSPLALPSNGLEEKVKAFMNQYGGVFGEKDDKLRFEFIENKKDDYGFSHVKLKPKYSGVEIFGSELRFHFNPDNKLTAINGFSISDININPFPNLSEGEAAATALTLMEEQTGGNYKAALFANKTNLFIFKDNLIRNQEGRVYLVYEVEVRNDADVREFLYIDAHTGKLVEQFTGMCHAMFRRLYEVNTGSEIWTEGDAFPGALDLWQQNELVAAEDMYNLFENTFGFTSYNGADAEMLTINNNPAIICPNATWNGVTANYCTGTASDDVVAHEWGHAYTEYTNNLIYAWQTGALNESYSDIWGETVDLLNGYQDGGEDLSLRTGCNSSDRWMVGEDATAFSSALRDMWDPTCKGDPGKVTDTQYHCATSDNGGVHINSGVNNKAYALLVDGGTYNGQTITAIGFTKAAHIFWRAQSVYLTNTSDFVNQADALEAACADLVGINLEGLSFTATPAGPSGEIITLADCQEVTDAIAAVEFRTEPNCTFTKILTNPAPDLCAAGSGPSTIYFEDFESGLSAWTISQIPVNPPTWDPREWIIDSSLPAGRIGSGAFGPDPIPVGDCNTDLDNGVIRMQSPLITIPASVVTPVIMKFEHYVATETNWDGGNIKYSLNSGAWTILPNSSFTFNGYNGTLNTAGDGNDNPMEGQVSFTGADGGSVLSSWGQSQIDLDGLGVGANDNIQFRFEMGSDGCNGNDGWYIDDLLICNCVVGLPVELSSFTVEAKGKEAVLEWVTVSEINSRGFEIERSKDGISEWQKIGYVEAAGNSNNRIQYTFTDTEPFLGKNYYRLQQMDLDGKFEYSKIESVEFYLGNNDGLLLSPNPFSNEISITVPIKNREKIEIEIYDSSGKLIFNRSSIISKGEPLFLNDFTQMPNGVYWLRVNTSNGIYTEKLVKK